jgi:hypothetical protein
MRSVSATNFHRKSGGAKPRDLRLCTRTTTLYWNPLQFITELSDKNILTPQ